MLEIWQCPAGMEDAAFVTLLKRMTDKYVITKKAYLCSESQKKVLVNILWEHLKIEVLPFTRSGD